MLIARDHCRLFVSTIRFVCLFIGPIAALTVLPQSIIEALFIMFDRQFYLVGRSVAPSLLLELVFGLRCWVD